MVATSSYKRITTPGLPYSLAEARTQLKNEEENFDDALITSLILASAEMTENKTGRAFMQSTYLWTGSDWPSTDSFALARLYPAPLVSVNSIQYYPSDSGSLTTLDTSKYKVDTNSVPGRIRIDEMPALADRLDAVQITYKVGYGASGATVDEQQQAIPEDIKAWMKLQLTTLYEMRQVYVPGQNVSNISTFADSLIYPYII